MSLLKGAISITRFRVMDPVADLTDDFITDRLQKNAFVSIDGTVEEEAMGWVEILDPLSTVFAPHTYNFGQFFSFGLRVDTRRVSNKTVNRYLNMAVAEAEKLSEQPLTAKQRRELKARVRMDLLSRTPVSTDVYEICWFPKQDEVWLVGAGSKLRERLEDLWRQTFGLGLMMKIPFVLAQDHLPAGMSADEFNRLAPAALFGGRS